MGNNPSSFAYVTLCTNDAYVQGAITMATSLRLTRTPHPIVCLTTRQISERSRELLDEIFDEVATVEEIDSGDEARLALLGRPELGVTLTKLHVWAMTRFERVVYLDADTIVLRNLDQLFTLEATFAASPDIGWPDCFNSGVFLCRPNLNTFRELVDLAGSIGSFDGGDQGLLNEYFRDWASTPQGRLPYLYNVVSTSFYSYKPAYARFRNEVYVFHFIGENKPWNSRFDAPNAPNRDMKELWWSFYDIYVAQGAKNLRKHRLSEDPEITRTNPLLAEGDSDLHPLALPSGGSGPSARPSVSPSVSTPDTGLAPSYAARPPASFPYTITYSAYVPPPTGAPSSSSSLGSTVPGSATRLPSPSVTYANIAGFMVPPYPYAAISTYPKGGKVSIPTYMQGGDVKPSSSREEHHRSFSNYRVRWEDAQVKLDLSPEKIEEQYYKTEEELAELNHIFEQLNLAGDQDAKKEEVGARIDHLEKRKEHLLSLRKK